MKALLYLWGSANVQKQLEGGKENKIVYNILVDRMREGIEVDMAAVQSECEVKNTP